MAKASTRGFDAGREHLGSVYAQGLIGASEKSGNTDQVMLELESLVSDVLDKLPTLRAVLSAPKVSVNEKERILDRAIGNKVSKVLLNALKVMARHGRLDVIGGMRDAFRKLYNELRGKVEVHVRAATPISIQLQEQIANRLRTMLGRDVDMKLHVDPELLGGIEVKVGDMLYDASLRTQLNRMRDRALRRTEESLRTTFDRFISA